MDQVIKILALTNNQILISEVVEGAAMDIGQPDCKLVNPCIITEGKMLEPYLMDYTRDNTLMMGSDKILTLVDPTPQLLLKYEDLLAPPALPPATPIEE